MSEPGKAVFLSYASQDALAAKRIADALRFSGVEVWFDAEGGLEQGDEWDTKIRRQIKECVLFIPIISANTEAREEGYFRLEWDLAAERARTIASGVAFILPVVIDGTKESDALVPDRFRSVQWTKLPRGNVPPDILQRFLKLWSHRTGAIKHASKEHGARSTELDPVGASLDDAGGRRPAAPLHRTAGPRWKLYGGVTVACITLAAGVAAWLSRKEPSAKPAPPVAAPLTAPATESAHLVERMWAIHDKINDGTPEEWAVAVEIGERLVKQDSLDAEAWAALSSVQMLYFIFGMDQAGERQLKALRAAERAVTLAPTSVNARISLATVRRSGNEAAKAEAVEIMRKLVAEQPGNRRVLRTAGNVFKTAELFEESLRAFDTAVALPGSDPIARLSRSDTLIRMGRYKDARAVVSQSLGFHRGKGALALHAVYALYIDDNLAEAEERLKELPVSWFQSESGAELASAIALFKRDPDQCREILSRYPGDRLRSMPKGIVLGSAYRAAGRLAAARAEWERVLREVEADLVVRPTDGVALSFRALARALLGRTADATADFDAWREMQRADGSSWRPMAGRVLLELGREKEAIEHLGEGLEKAKGLLLLGRAAELRRSPDFDRIRNRGEFQALLAKVDAILPRPSAAAVSSKIVDKSVAVLAFENRSSEKDSEYFSDGVSDELINVLGRVAGLKVVARTSSFTFKGNKAVSVREIARTLGVAHLVEGSVQQVGGRARVIARLILADTGEQLWGDSFDVEVRDILSEQVTIARAIAQAMALRLTSGSRMESLNPEAVQLYLQGRQEWGKRTVDAMRRAEDLFKRAIALEPKFTRAHAGLVDVWATLGQQDDSVGLWSERDSNEMSRIVERARLAVALDPDSAEAHTSLGGALVEAWQPAEARRAFERALELNSNYATAHQWLGRALLKEGRAAEAVASLRRACELDPLSSRMADNLGISLWLVGRGADGLAELDRALMLQPDSEQAQAQRAMVLAGLGRREEAVAVAREVLQRGGFRVMHAVCALAVAGRQEEAARAFDSLPKARALSRRAHALAALGRWDDCLTALQPETRVPATAEQMIYHPVFDPIRNDPRFVAALDTLGLRDAHARAQAWRAANPPQKVPPGQ